MKAFITILLIITALAIQAGPASISTLIPVQEEAYVDDITFNTAGIAFMYRNCSLPVDEEGYVDDIPFNTREVAARARIPMEQEQQVPDIFTRPGTCPGGLAASGHATDLFTGLQTVLSELQGLAYELSEISAEWGVIRTETIGEMIHDLNQAIENEIRFVMDDLGMIRVF